MKNMAKRWMIRSIMKAMENRMTQTKVIVSQKRKRKALRRERKRAGEMPRAGRAGARKK
jgi:hypothetical protein